MATPVEVPKLGNTVEECLVSRWVKRKGETVAAGELVAEIETDKATFEVTAPVAGTLLATFFDEGALVPVFTNLFVIGEAGESVEAFRPGVAAAAPAPIVEKVAEAPSAVASPVEPAEAGATAYSPRARRFADEHHFHPPKVTGSGPGGRVVEEDLRKLYYASTRATAETGDAAPPAAQISNIRSKIAQRMRESLTSTAQYTLNSWADAGGLLTLRARIKASKGVADININDLVTFCAIKALQQMPELNVEFISGKLHKHTEIHIGFAVDTPRGLLVAVVRDAHAMPIGDLATKMKELSTQAVAGNISADNLSGATFTISNLGGLGIETFTPLLNPPQVAILGVGAINLKPVRKQGRVEFIDAISLSLTCDHQIIDGAPGARFLQVVKDKIENVESLCTI